MPGSCANPTVGIYFTPMYSAFIPGSTAHTFQIPAVTDDGNPAQWSASDPTQVQLVPQAFGNLQGVMITVMGVGTGTPGQVTLYATEADGSCGASVLTITSSTENDWQIGNTRYNNNVTLQVMRPPGGGMRPDGGDGGGGGVFRTDDGGSYYEVDGGTACTNCHGPTATTGPYKDVSHSPEQTGGFSDDDLVNIFHSGILPDGGYFDPTVLLPNCDGGPICTEQAKNIWHSFHQWTDIQPDQYPGIVVYLRSLQPVSQNGMANFGGRGRRDGGAGFGRDGGMRGRMDAGVTMDAGGD
jgi:hypothetical protein